MSRGIRGELSSNLSVHRDPIKSKPEGQTNVIENLRCLLALQPTSCASELASPLETASPQMEVRCLFRAQKNNELALCRHRLPSSARPSDAVLSPHYSTGIADYKSQIEQALSYTAAKRTARIMRLCFTSPALIHVLLHCTSFHRV